MTPGDTVSALAKGNGTDKQEQPLMLMLAQYGANDRLLKANSAETETAEGEAFDFQTEPMEILEDAVCIKAFLWERDSLKPLRGEINKSLERETE